MFLRKLFTLGLISCLPVAQTGNLCAQNLWVTPARQVSTTVKETEKISTVTKTLPAFSAGYYTTVSAEQTTLLTYQNPTVSLTETPNALTNLCDYDYQPSTLLSNRLSREILRGRLRARQNSRNNVPADIAENISFWRQDAQHQVHALRRRPTDIFRTKKSVSDTNAAVAAAPLADLITDIGALGIFGEKTHEAPFLLNLHQQLQETPFEAPVVTITARALLRLEAYEALQTLAYRYPDPTYIWDGIWTYAANNHIDLPLLPSERPYQPADKPFQTWLEPFGQLAANAADPSYQATQWYMQVADKTSVSRPTRPAPKTAPAPMPTPPPPIRLSDVRLIPRATTLYNPQTFSIAASSPFVQSATTARPISYTLLTKPASPGTISTTNPVNASFGQRASLYLTSFVMGFEIGQPIIASLGESLNRSLPESALVTAATFLPYALGAFWANHLNRKIGRRTLLDLGLGILGSSLAAGTLLLELDGSFSPWANEDAHFYSILTALTLASLGSTVMHCAVGPLMSSINRHVSSSVRQRQTAMTELSQAGGLLASFFFPLAATRYLGLDWSAPFLLSLPLVTAAGIGLRTARLPNPKPTPLYQPDKTAHKSLGEKLKHSEYARLLKQDTTLTKRVGALALVNGIEASLNSGFLLLLPQMTSSSSSQYTLGLVQFAAPFALGSLLGTQLLKWVPNKSLRVSAAITATGALSALAFTHNLYGLTASLFTAELGLSSAYTLSFAKTAATPQTQDKATTLLVGSTLTAAVAPFVFSEVAQALVSSGVLSLPNAIMATMIGLPGLLSLGVWRLFRNIEKRRSIH